MRLSGRLAAGLLLGLAVALAGCLQQVPDLPSGSAVELVSAGAVWRILDDGSDPGEAWRSVGFDDASWRAGNALLGYGVGDEATTLRCQRDWPTGAPCPPETDGDRLLTTFLRHRFAVDDPERFDWLRLRLLKDDGAIVFLNGEMVARANMRPGVVGANQPAASEVEAKRRWQDYRLDPRKLVPGQNMLAVELHQASVRGPSVAFDLELVAFDPAATALRRGPYLQRLGPTSVEILWRTGDRVASGLRYVDAATGGEVQEISHSQPRLEHRVSLSGLQPGTTYVYGIAAGGRRLAGLPSDDAAADAPTSGWTARFTTPSDDPNVPLRVWAIGDSGTGNAFARKVRDAYWSYANRPPDVWLTLGDNAYDDGTDEEYQRTFFDVYPRLLASTSVWPTLGNHDLKARRKNQPLPYFEIFDLPTDGELGGVASGAEAYYSFDRGPVHFVALDTAAGDLRPTREMLTWLVADLEATDLPWTVVYFHHPPYTDGWHRSDDPERARLYAIRENVVPILDDAGVDLVLSGHSHSYERSFLLYGHYGTSNNLRPSMVIDGGDGRETGDGAYRQRAGRGTVYVVAGSAGLLASGELQHPTMAVSMLEYGSLVLDVTDQRLDGRFLTLDGDIADHFTLLAE